MMRSKKFLGPLVAVFIASMPAYAADTDCGDPGQAAPELEAQKAREQEAAIKELEKAEKTAGGVSPTSRSSKDFSCMDKYSDLNILVMLGIPSWDEAVRRLLQQACNMAEQQVQKEISKLTTGKNLGYQLPYGLGSIGLGGSIGVGGSGSGNGNVYSGTTIGGSKINVGVQSAASGGSMISYARNGLFR